MGCGASSAAGDVAAATRVDDQLEKDSHQTAEARKEAVPSQDASKAESRPQETGKQETSKVTPMENVTEKQSAEAQSLEADPSSLQKEQQVASKEQEAPAQEEKANASVAENTGSLTERSTTSSDQTKAPDNAEKESEAQAAASADPLLTKRQSLNKLPPLESPLKVDLAKDPFAKPVLPTSVPLASSPAASPVGVKTPGSLPGTPTLSDSPVAGNRPAESKPLGPSALSKSSADSVVESKPEATIEHTPRTATEAALEALMDDVSVASK